MPYVQLKLFGTRPAPAVLHRLQAGLTDLMSAELRKSPRLTVVEIEHADSSHLAAGGAPLGPEHWSGRLIAFVTAGTNSAEEKAAFLAAAQGLLVGLLGPAATPLYLIVQELDAESWGYDGLTQSARSRAAVVAPTA